MATSIVCSETRKGEAAVRVFLQSIHPAMDGLTPIFIHHGVTDGTYLRVLAELPEDKQTKFLQCDLGLNAMQATIIRLALCDM